MMRESTLGVAASERLAPSGFTRWKSAVAFLVASVALIWMIAAAPGASAAPPPTNDNVANAEVVALGDTVTGSTVDATAEAGETVENLCTTNVLHSVWYKWEAPVSANVRIATDASFDTQLGVYTATDASDLSTFVPVGCNDDIRPGITNSEVFVGAVIGQTYLIRVEGIDAAAGIFSLTVEAEPCTSVGSASVDAGSGIGRHECDALEEFYALTGGSTWTNNAGWTAMNGTAATNPCTWHGVTCNSTGSISSLILRSNSLTASIDALYPALDMLPALEILDLGGNGLTGEIGTGPVLPMLRGLYLHANELQGIIPSELSHLTNLKDLWLNNNELSGEIPSELGDHANLERLHLYSNELSGEIPSELGELANLTELRLNNNELSGEIPSELGDLTNLVWLHLNSNELQGIIPSELSHLTKLKDLWLNNNELSGEIPSELGDLANLERLLLYSNELSGPIPPSLGNLTNMNFLFLADNDLSGLVPEELAALTLDDLSLSGNGCLTAGPNMLAVITASNTASALNNGCEAVDDPDAAVVGAPGSVTFDVIGNDAIPASAVTAVTIVSGPSAGAAVVNADFSITYTPDDPPVFGTDEFTYEMCSYTFCHQAAVSVLVEKATCGGNDITIFAVAGVVTNGTPGNDVILGTEGADVINGGDGDDTICGLGGPDRIFGDDGNDIIFGGVGWDTLDGSRGDDMVYGGVGNDVMFGGWDDDELFGGDGDDLILGFGGTDVIDAGSGKDRINGQNGDDTINGGTEADQIWGSFGNDTLNGGEGWDLIFGGWGEDRLDGGSGNDTLFGEANDDTLFGGDGNDTLNGGWTNDTLDGGNGTDRCDGDLGTDTATLCETITNIP